MSNDAYYNSDSAQAQNLTQQDRSYYGLSGSSQQPQSYGAPAQQSFAPQQSQAYGQQQQAYPQQQQGQYQQQQQYPQQGQQYQQQGSGPGPSQGQYAQGQQQYGANGKPAMASEGDKLDQAVDSLLTKFGKKQNAATTEKISDGVRSVFKKVTGKNLPIKDIERRD